MKLFKRSAFALIIIGLLSRALGFKDKLYLHTFMELLILQFYLISLVIQYQFFNNWHWNINNIYSYIC